MGDQERIHKSVGIQVDEKVSRYATYIFEPVDTTVWNVAHEEDDMKVCGEFLLSRNLGSTLSRSTDVKWRRTMWL